MHSLKFIREVENYVKVLLEENLPQEIVINSIKHTIQVVVDEPFGKDREAIQQFLHRPDIYQRIKH